jgi:hypothetical protein
LHKSTRRRNLVENIFMKSIIIISALILVSCYSGMDDDYTYVDPAIRPYFDDFVRQAAARGIEIDTFGAKVCFGPMNEEGRQGYTSYRYNQVFIDSSSYKWKTCPETIVFHELGHLFLHREHDNYRVNYNPTSIMDSQEIPEYVLGRPELREYYLDELFDPNTRLPEEF